MVKSSLAEQVEAVELEAAGLRASSAWLSSRLELLKAEVGNLRQLDAQHLAQMDSVEAARVQAVMEAEILRSIRSQLEQLLEAKTTELFELTESRNATILSYERLEKSHEGVVQTLKSLEKDYEELKNRVSAAENALSGSRRSVAELTTEIERLKMREERNAEHLSAVESASECFQTTNRALLAGTRRHRRQLQDLVPVLRTLVQQNRLLELALRTTFKLVDAVRDSTTIESLQRRAHHYIHDRRVDKEVFGLLEMVDVAQEDLQNLPDAEEEEEEEEEEKEKEEDGTASQASTAVDTPGSQRSELDNDALTACDG